MSRAVSEGNVTETHTDRQKDTDTRTQTNKHTDRYTDRHTLYMNKLSTYLALALATSRIQIWGLTLPQNWNTFTPGSYRSSWDMDSKPEPQCVRRSAVIAVSWQQTNERPNERTNERTNERMNEHTNRQTNGWLYTFKYNRIVNCLLIVIKGCLTWLYCTSSAN